MGVQITVRGVAEARHPAERALVRLEAVVEGTDRADVRDRAAALQEPLAGHLRDLAALGAVDTWSSDQVTVHGSRPWVGDRRSEEVVHTASVQLRAEFVDFERMNGFLDHWAGVAGVEVLPVEWDLGVRSRRVLEAEVRKAAVDDAVSKAQTYADAVRRGRVVALQLADPGMLDGRGDAVVVGAVARGLDVGADRSGIALVPEDIVVRVEVDARFQAD
ncbi:SIMPL domain-containing protein [Aeromicrobium sp. CnD17-E]|uniref:SIMPL domain-containing protein n=1 Tax=Aeromicrobium sp. CnD17-E TaxID=2954487 RepID=UPI002096B895|nr:SIMPL domain-containing protein [Aeromicrobium sp. CnD17-E]MCO7240727.1 SIMPL domain-containing protein [Aeromicrobium sp. CnD17-E]